MESVTLQIEKSSDKGRGFRATLLGLVSANDLWQGGQTRTDDIRPAWIMFTGTVAEMKAFVANLQLGNKAEFVKDSDKYTYSGHRINDKIELLKSAGYEYLWQYLPGSNPDDDSRVAVVTAYLPSLFHLDPGMVDPDYVRFIMLTPKWWVAQELEKLEEVQFLADRLLAHGWATEILSNEFDSWWWTWADSVKSDGYKKCQVHRFLASGQDLLRYIPLSSYFAAYLDKHCSRPIVNSREFHFQLYFYALRERIATLSVRTDPPHIGENDDPWNWARDKRHSSYSEVNVDEIGLVPGLAVNVTQSRLDEFLTRQVQLYSESQLKAERKLNELLQPANSGSEVIPQSCKCGNSTSRTCIHSARTCTNSILLPASPTGLNQVPQTDLKAGVSRISYNQPFIRVRSS